MDAKTAGILLHISSLPSRHGIGDMAGAVKYVLPFLKRTYQSAWQVLPIHPVGYGHSPYQGLSAFAGNELFVSPELLREDGLLTLADVENPPQFNHQFIEFEKVSNWKEKLFRKAFRNYLKESPPEDYIEFIEQHSLWLEDYCLFMAIKQQEQGRPWHEWPEGLKKRNRQALKAFAAVHGDEIAYRRFIQFVFFRQWQSMYRQFREARVQIIGDMPIFVAHDSADVWSDQDLFSLDSEGKPSVIAGVPPDYFSRTGQRWGNPHYQWPLMEKTGFKWWTQRSAHLLEMMDVLRIDHFRGFESYWEIPGQEKTAVRGRWVKAPGEKLFQTLRQSLGHLPFIAEDLGVITPEVRSLQKLFGLPGMKILQFSFDPKVNRRERPAHYEKHTYAYTGTHDNDTLKGWFVSQGLKEKGIRKTLSRYHGIRENDPVEVCCKKMIEMLMNTNAGHVIIPLQDYFFLGTEARMNYPGTVGGNNWRWRSLGSYYDDEKTIEWIRGIIENAGRL